MKTYIFFTFNISQMGGGQLYVGSKAKYLESIGWKVAIIYPFYPILVKHSNLEKYCNGGIIGFGQAPHKYFRFIRDIIIFEILRKIDINKNETEIIIESNDDTTALWAEIVAKKINAKHVCFNCNEKFRGRNKDNYLDKIDFFNFKHKRRELACIAPDAMKNLFDGYKTITDKECYYFGAANYGAVQEINNEIEVNLQKQLFKDAWNICYIGRINKQYVDNIVKGVYEFSKKHLDKKINFICVGDISSKKNQINTIFKNLSNCNLVELGNLLPIPKSIFKYFDVVIAGAGCAFCSITQHVLTIIPDSKSCKCNGIWGVDTYNTLFAEPNVAQRSYEDCLEKVLVKKEYNKEEIKWLEIQKEDEINSIFEDHLNFVKKSDKEKCFYIEKKLCYGKKTVKTNLCYIKNKIKSMIKQMLKK